jgi:hypothetical protein
VPLNLFIGREVVLGFRDCPADQELNAGDIQRWEEMNYPLSGNEAVLFCFGRVWSH